MAERPRPIGSDPIQRVSYPMGLIRIGPVHIGSGLGLNREMPTGYRVSSGPKSFTTFSALLLLYASKPPSTIRTPANSHRCDTRLQLVLRSLVFVSLRQPRGESSTGLHSSVAAINSSNTSFVLQVCI